MNIADLVNGVFELSGAAFIGLNVRQILKDKMIKGVHWGPTVFFTAWGFWNLYYYPSLDQWLSFAGGCGIVATNCAWLFLVAKYWGNDSLTPAN